MLKDKHNRKKTLIIAILMALPTAMLLSFLIHNAKADSDIPENTYINPYNEWHWTIDEGDQFYYEMNMSMRFSETQELVSSFRTLYIVNISSITNVTNYNLMGPQLKVSMINGTNLFHNVTTNKLEAIGEPYNMGVFVFNGTVQPNLRYGLPQGFPVPLILPINGSKNFEANIMAKVVNDSFYYAYFREEINRFNEFGSVGEGKMWFKSDDGYFINSTYNASGILEVSKGKYCFYNSDPEYNEIMDIEYSLIKVLDYNATDEIDWGADIGYVTYMGRSTSGDEDEDEDPGFGEVKIEIARFNVSNYEIETAWGYDILAFQNIIANIYMWDNKTEEYVYMDQVIIGAANNYYPWYPWALESAVMPNTTIIDDLEFMGEYYLASGASNYEVNSDDYGWYFEVWSPYEDMYYYSHINDTMGSIILSYTRTEGELSYVLFSKDARNISGAAISEELWSATEINTNVSVNFLVSDLGIVELYSSVIDVNPFEPVGSPFYDDIPGFTVYIDTYCNDSISISHLNYTIDYSDDILEELGIPESMLQVYWFNDIVKQWMALDDANYTIYSGSDKITVNTTKFEMLTIGIPEVWNWSDEINVGKKLMYESTGTLMGNVSDFGIVSLPYIDFSILNITAVGLGLKDDKFYNQVNGTLLYYDPEFKALVTWKEPGTLVFSEYNYSAGYFNFSLTPYTLGFPMMIPLRWDQLALEAVGLALNESFYSSSIAREIGFPIWDDIYANYVDRTLVFNDTVTDYYMMLKYYDNGTLEEAEIYTKFNIDETSVDFNLTTTRMFDYNQTDEVEWGVDVGNVFYFGGNFPSGGPTVEIKATIVAINQSAVYLHELFFGEDGGSEGFPFFQTWLTFENVWAKIEFWNITSQNGGMQTGEWLPIEYNDTIIIGEANNYFPFIFGDYNGYYGIEAQTIPMILPNGTDGHKLADDYSDFLGLISLMVFEGEVIPHIESVRADYLKIEYNVPEYPTYDLYTEMYLNNETGVLRFFYMYQEFEGESHIACIFTKNHSVEVSAGNYKYKFNNYLVSEISGNLTMDSTGAFEIFEAMLNRNPVNNSIPSSWGTPMFYLDFFYKNDSNGPWNMTVSLKLPSKYYVGYVTSIAMYNYNITDREVGKWELESIDDIPFGYVTRDYQNNILTIHMINVNGTISVVEAWFYSPPAGYLPPAGDDDDDGAETPAAIPGFNLWIILVFIAMISLVTIFKRKKLIELA